VICFWRQLHAPFFSTFALLITWKKCESS
jgi:hypothetical protein